ncbi:LEAF RUST 10 DISEASE-RESISTANCE LOCUS RECEPTOR-LIKE PROTEIN KINASE-like 2.1 [Mangifera indica]|uniref:LEAF RUST 10 DISEASE-RESISTANCE LOCUS RECEPTOR-LIKE PROTEIN KINASE-like 2.1 n=1 Tax=Mangifera indica TaxID=29780 RepID=UPI001CFB4100|nr:LEAF RUST 10 DISEASE-RESISTANCE LOCUS RECEPTOR-LIKE PROTEIN KINASE-like 2.1 [Mangifera indica]
MFRVTCFLFFIISRLLVLTLAVEEEGGNPRCNPFECGSLGSVGFPFFDGTNRGCGFLKLDNCSEQVPRIKLHEDWPWFYITAISQTNTITLQENETFLRPVNYCAYRNLSLPSSPFLSVEPYNQTFFRCPAAKNYTNLTAVCEQNKNFTIGGDQSGSSNEKFGKLHPDCSVIQLVVNKTQKRADFLKLYTGWFRLQLNVTRECTDCFQRGGVCQDNQGQFQCSTDVAGQNGEDGHSVPTLGIAIAVAATGFSISIVLAIYCWRRLSQHNAIFFWEKKTKDYQNIEAFLRNHGSLAPKRYSYSDIKKITNSFQHKLGQGGYGAVYKGKLFDGCCVAVKVLTEFKGNGEEFINEIASISKTSHVNIVTLLGFCFEGRKRALMYEFMSNGSLDKIIHEKGPIKWETLYQIAVGIARGLEYLHRGCNTRILHFDIKPHNILLNEDFCPKISDFGLAKICPKKESIVSMTDARGTIGYIAPEMFYRSFGAVSYKSDVYSYGMMIIEITGGRQNNNVQAENSSELYFPQWIYERLEEDEELGLHGISNEDDKELVRKMIIVSLWCIQTNPLDRPTMSRVVEMLEGSIHSLQIPPKPFLSPARSAPTDSSISLVS